MREGRVLELLVEEIQKVLYPKAKITTPEYVEDADTGQQREVDIGVRVHNGGPFIAIECRDRKQKQDVTWIEQLIAKKDSIQADLMIAITSSKFTEPAIGKAEKRGVLLRTIKEFSGEEVLDYSERTYVEVAFIRTDVFVRYIRVPADAESLIPRDAKDCVFHIDKKYLKRPKEIPEKLSREELGYILAESNQNQIFPMIRKGVPEANEPHSYGESKSYHVELGVHGIYLLTPKKVPVPHVTLKLVSKKYKKRLPLQKGITYHTQEENQEVIEYFTYGQKGHIVKVIVNTKDGTGYIEFGVGPASALRDREDDFVYYIELAANTPFHAANYGVQAAYWPMNSKDGS